MERDHFGMKVLKSFHKLCVCCTSGQRTAVQGWHGTRPKQFLELLFRNPTPHSLHRPHRPHYIAHLLESVCSERHIDRWRNQHVVESACSERHTAGAISMLGEQYRIDHAIRHSGTGG